MIASFAHGVQLGYAYSRRDQLGPTQLVVRGRGVGRFLEQRRRRQRCDRATRGRRVIEVKRRGDRSDGGHGQKHHHGGLPRLPYVHGGRRRSDNTGFAVVVVVVVMVVTPARRRCMQLRFDSAPVDVVAVVAGVAAAAAAASAATAVPAVGHNNAVIGAANRKLSGLRRNIVDRRLLLGRVSVGHRSGNSNCSRRHRRRCGRSTAATVVD